MTSRKLLTAGFAVAVILTAYFFLEGANCGDAVLRLPFAACQNRTRVVFNGKEIEPTVSKQRAPFVVEPITTQASSSGSIGKEFSETSSWQIFTNAEDFYSIRYPNLGSFVVRYSAIPHGTTLGFKGVGAFDIGIKTIEPNGLRLAAWLLAKEGIDVALTKPGDLETTTVDEMDGVLVFDPQIQRVSSFVEQDFSGNPLIYRIDFTSYVPATPYPPFWNTMLSTFRSPPE